MTTHDEMSPLLCTSPSPDRQRDVHFQWHVTKRYAVYIPNHHVSWHIASKIPALPPCLHTFGSSGFTKMKCCRLKYLRTCRALQTCPVAPLNAIASQRSPNLQWCLHMKFLYTCLGPSINSKILPHPAYALSIITWQNPQCMGRIVSWLKSNQSRFMTCNLI